MAMSVGASAQKIPQPQIQPLKPQTQSSRDSKDTLSSADLAPALKQAVQCAGGPTAAATQVATQAVGSLLNTKA